MIKGFRLYLFWLVVASFLISDCGNDNPVKPPNEPGYVKQIRLVDVTTGQPLSSLSMNLNDNITIGIQGILSIDTTNTWIYVYGEWSLAPNISSADPIPTSMASQWDFSPTAAGGPSQLTVTVGTGIHIFKVQIPVVVVACSTGLGKTGKLTC